MSVVAAAGMADHRYTVLLCGSGGSSRRVRIIDRQNSGAMS
jgi:hypothetical protein